MKVFYKNMMLLATFACAAKAASGPGGDLTDLLDRQWNVWRTEDGEFYFCSNKDPEYCGIKTPAGEQCKKCGDKTPVVFPKMLNPTSFGESADSVAGTEQDSVDDPWYLSKKWKAIPHIEMNRVPENKKKNGYWRNDKMGAYECPYGCGNWDVIYFGERCERCYPCSNMQSPQEASIAPEDSSDDWGKWRAFVKSDSTCPRCGVRKLNSDDSKCENCARTAWRCVFCETENMEHESHCAHCRTERYDPGEWLNPLGYCHRDPFADPEEKCDFQGQDQAGWDCNLCTFHNKSPATRCGMCQAKPGQENVSATQNGMYKE